MYKSRKYQMHTLRTMVVHAMHQLRRDKEDEYEKYKHAKRDPSFRLHSTEAVTYLAKTQALYNIQRALKQVLPLIPKDVKYEPMKRGWNLKKGAGTRHHAKVRHFPKLRKQREKEALKKQKQGVQNVIERVTKSIQKKKQQNTQEAA